jgi:pyruvate dehydrogenase E1 component
MGEGLQHQDGHSLLLASAVPPCQAYDPAFAYELGVIVDDGLKRMFVDNEDIFYYLAVYNENYEQPQAPPDLDQDALLAGLYRFANAPLGHSRSATIIFSGPAQAAARSAVELLAENHDVAADLWSATSFKALRDEALSAERHNLLHPEDPVRVPFVTRQLAGGTGPVVAVTDFMRSVPDQISRWVERDYASLGTDGFGRSDTRSRLREHFEVTAEHVVICVLTRLVALGHCEPSAVSAAIKRYGIVTNITDPWSTDLY